MNQRNLKSQSRRDKRNYMTKAEAKKDARIAARYKKMVEHYESIPMADLIALKAKSMSNTDYLALKNTIHNREVRDKNYRLHKERLTQIPQNSDEAVMLLEKIAEYETKHLDFTPVPAPASQPQ